MPCTDGRDSPWQEGHDYAKKQFRHNSDVAEMLCTVLGKMGPLHVRALPEPIRQWWAEHQERDRKKAQDEAKKQRQAKAQAEIDRAVQEVTEAIRKKYGV